MKQARPVVDFLNLLLEAERAGVKVLGELWKKVEDPGLKSIVAAFKDDEAQLDLLNRGQSWVARRIEERLDAIDDAETRAFLTEMAQRHRRNVETCERMLRHLYGRTATI